MHRNTVEFEVYGDYALFSDPVMRTGGEKCSYQVPTYEALKGILSSVYAKPTFIWVIDSVRVMNQIQTEAKGIRTLRYNGGNDLSFYTYLKNVRYQVRAHFEWNENRPELAEDRNEHKHHNIAKRMIEKGGRRDVFLGVRECQAYVEPCVFGEGDSFYDTVPELSFGLMHHSFIYPDCAFSKETAGHLSYSFWHSIMRKGVIEFCRPEESSIIRQIRPEKMKIFSLDRNNFTGHREFEEGGV